jgi:rhodanese-related sulfurtransferase
MSRVIIDVREPYEYERGHVEGAINIPPAELLAGAKYLQGAPKDSELILYCVSGSRSTVSKNILESMGFTNVVNGINKEHVLSKYF